MFLSDSRNSPKLLASVSTTPSEFHWTTSPELNNRRRSSSELVLNGIEEAGQVAPEDFCEVIDWIEDSDRVLKVSCNCRPPLCWDKTAWRNCGKSAGGDDRPAAGE